jgi:voltage-gated potassium channel Kch
MEQKKSPLTKTKLWPLLHPKRWRRFEWGFIALLWLFGLLLGYAGFARHAALHGEPRSFLDLIYFTFQLITMNSGAVDPPVPAALQIARFLLPFVSAYAVFRGLAQLFRKQWERFTLRFASDHVVICGLSRKGYLLAQSFSQNGERVVVVERDETNDWLEACRELGVTVVEGDAADPNTLRLAGVDRAAALIAVLDDDGANAAIAMQARRLKTEDSAHRQWIFERTPLPLTCSVHLSDPRLVDLVRGREFSPDYSPAFRLEFFNVFDFSARTMLQEHSALFKAEAPAELHLLVIGLGRLGETLTAYAAGEWHALRDGASGLLITVVDVDAGARVHRLYQRYPQLTGICCIFPVELEVHSPEFAEAAFLQDPNSHAVDEVYVCLDSDLLGISTALLLRRRLDRRVSIAVRIAQAGGLEALLEGGQAEGIHAFPLLERACKADLLVAGVHETLARALHEDHLRRSAERGERREDNPALVPWEVLPERMRASSYRQARTAIQHLAALGYQINALSDWSEAASFRFSEREIEELAQMDLEAQEHDPRLYSVLPLILPRVGLQMYRNPNRDRAPASASELILGREEP